MPEVSARVTKQNWRRKLRFTRAGKFFVVLTLAIGFAAINTGNNLLYLVLGTMLASIIGSGVLSENSLKKLSITRIIPAELYCDTRYEIRLKLTNHKRWMPSFAVVVEDLSTSQSDSTHTTFFLYIAARSSAHQSYSRIFDRRGWQHFVTIRLKTKFPFGLFEKSLDIPCAQTALIYPHVHSIAHLQNIISPRHIEFDRNTQVGHGGDFYALRDYRQGDDPRRIHWRKTATLGRVVLRQTERPNSDEVVLILDNGAKVATEFELLVRQAASLAVAYLARGYAVGLQSRTDAVAISSGPFQRQHLLRTLALLEQAPSSSSESSHTIKFGHQSRAYGIMVDKTLTEARQWR